MVPYFWLLYRYISIYNMYIGVLDLVYRRAKNKGRSPRICLPIPFVPYGFHLPDKQMGAVWQKGRRGGLANEVQSK